MSAVMPVYKRSKLTFSHGEGAYLYAPDGEAYLDFAAGIAVNSLGHGHPHAVEALTEQAKKLWHISNLYTVPGLDDYAERLVAHCFADKVFFCNSGAEAIECAIKMMRKYHDDTDNPDKYRVITFKGSFHGRTLTAISASDRDKVMQGFEPAVQGFDNVPFNDLEAVKEAIGEETAGILVEPIQGEGGIRPADKEFLQGLRDLADEHGLLLCFDEIQCGMGRTGTLFCYESYDVEPDILTAAKGIGNGFPIGACLANDKAASAMQPGTHGSTYGNNPLAMAVGNAVFDVLTEDGFLENVNEVADYLQAQLQELMDNFPKNTPSIIEEVRGKGLMLGLKVTPPNTEVVEKLREHKLLTAPASDNIVRLLPPLIITKEQVDEALEKIKLACEEFNTND